MYYKKYCSCEKRHFDDLIIKSISKSKSTWNIVKPVTNNRNTTNNIASVSINKNFINNPITIADAFNAYFSSAAGNLKKIFQGNIILLRMIH